ncbi:MAG TPA: hypothetical protein VGM90_21975 [Kofleriaceae bacterium]
MRAALDVFAALKPGEIPFNTASVRKMFDVVEAASHEDLDLLIADLSQGLADPDVWRAACAAISCGTLVENGASPAIVALPLLERMIVAARQLSGIDAITTDTFAGKVLDAVDNMERRSELVHPCGLLAAR